MSLVLFSNSRGSKEIGVVNLFDCLFVCQQQAYKKVRMCQQDIFVRQ